MDNMQDVKTSNQYIPGILQMDSNWIRPSGFPDLSSGMKAVDIETHDLGLNMGLGPGWCFSEKKRGHIVGISVYHESGFCGYYPIGHNIGENFSKDVVYRWLRNVMSNGTIIAHNAAYDLGWLSSVDVKPGSNAKVVDTYIASALAQWNDRKHDLDSVARRFGVDGKDKSSLYYAASLYKIDKDKIYANMANFLPEHVGPYAEADVAATFKIWQELSKLIDKFKLNTVFNLEMDVMHAVVAMRMLGVRINALKCIELKSQMNKKVNLCIDEITHKTGVKINPWNSESIAAALRVTGFECPKSRTGLTSATKEVLFGLSGLGNDVAKLILEARTSDKAAQFVENVENHAIPYNSKSGRIHAEFHPLWYDGGGARTGRFSSSNPNLQNLPARDENVAKAIRGLFLPEEGFLWDCFDFSSQEPRITVHWACHKNYEGAENARQQYLSNNNHDFHAWAAKLFSRPRKQAKALFLGKVYCKGGASMCDELGLPTIYVLPPNWDVEVPVGTKGAVRVAGQDGQRLIHAFDQELPFIKMLQMRCAEYARRTGYITTISGRRVPVRADDRHKAINYKIQGSAADQMKRAIVACHKAGYTPRITVHDENDFVDLPDDRARREVIDLMEHCCDDWFVVPAKVDAEQGENWGEIC